MKSSHWASALLAVGLVIGCGQNQPAPKQSQRQDGSQMQREELKKFDRKQRMTLWPCSGQQEAHDQSRELFSHAISSLMGFQQRHSRASSIFKRATSAHPSVFTASLMRTHVLHSIVRQGYSKNPLSINDIFAAVWHCANLDV
jgi:hypothetical protein